MQEALPFKAWTPPILQEQTSSLGRSLETKSINDNNNRSSSASASSSSSSITRGHVRDMVLENAVIVFGRRGCCMSYVVKRLLHGLGVNPAVYEVEEDEEASVISKLETIDDHDHDDQGLQFPAIFIGGRLFGGLDRIMATHITGELIPILKQAGALWL